MSTRPNPTTGPRSYAGFERLLQSLYAADLVERRGDEMNTYSRRRNWRCITAGAGAALEAPETVLWGVSA